jgi:phosphate transport system permease protein
MSEDTRLSVPISAGPKGEARPRVAFYTRPKRTPRRVLIVDRAADWIISVGGLAVIAAVIGIMAFLVQVVVPLFSGSRVLASQSFTLPGPPIRPLSVSVDEYGAVGVEVLASGGLHVFHAATGRLLFETYLELGFPVTAFSRTLSGGHFVFGLEDGSVRFGRVNFQTRILAAGEAPAGLTRLDGRDETDGRAVYTPIPGAQVRRVEAVAEVFEPQRVSPDGLAIVALDYRVGGAVERPKRAVAAADAAGNVVLVQTESRLNLLTRKLTTTARETRLPRLAEGREIAALLLTEPADEVYLAERSGELNRFDVRDFARPSLAETRDVLPGPPELTSLSFLIGEQSIVVGGSDGSVSVWFRTHVPGAPTPDGRALVQAHRLEPHAAAVAAIAPSQRSKSFATSDREGNVFLRHSTSEQVLLRFPGALPPGASVAAISGRDDALLALSEARQAAFVQFDTPHPETTLRTIFGRVWYEGYPEPTWTWQSSSGTDVFEPKFSLVPLIFGTVKATLYSLLFAVPIALLAAIYTSEFVHPRVRTAVKPTMEMMASLPSVVLGFIAALVLAPVVESWIASVLSLLLAIPIALVLVAHLWQLLPAPLALRLDGLPKFGLMFLAVAAGALAALRGGVLLERQLFGGDLRLWLDGGIGTGQPFLFLVLLPLAFLVTGFTLSRLLGARLDALLRSLTRPQAGVVEALRWLATSLGAVALAWLGSALLAASGVDPRGGVVGTYVQRNTLVVGFAMGFAVIPIIYTIAEDAMSAVPSHLRAASLACGATPWQTAIGVVVPTAMSGIFAAVMIGMGRAVGETMIVVMAAGNTPILDWNIFNGLRALSANIAVELPEAVKDGSLYRMLFLAALLLFAMTFLVNTIAELVRLRFRKRAAEL